MGFGGRLLCLCSELTENCIRTVPKLMFLTIRRFNLGLVLYAVAAARVAVWLLIYMLPRDDFAVSSV